MSMSVRVSLTDEQVHLINAAIHQFKETGCVGCPKYDDCAGLTFRPCQTIWTKLNDPGA